MKIVCGSCSAKYTVSDDKVQGKAVKVKCKKCGAVLVVAPDGQVTTQGGSSAAPAVTYTVSVSDADQRSMTLADVVAAYNEGVIDAETFVWAEGMDDWAPLKDVDAIVDALHTAAQGGTEATAEAVAGDLGSTMAMPEGGLPSYDAALAAQRAAAAAPAPAPVPPAPQAPGEGLASTVAMDEGAAARMFGGAGVQPAPTPAAAPAGGGSFPKAKATLLGGMAPISPGMFGNISVSASAPAAGFGGPSAGSTDENSAIFSLNTLTAKAAGGPSKPSSATSEDSGLIDLKALAAGIGGGGAGATVLSDAPPVIPAADAGLFPLAAPPPVAVPAPQAFQAPQIVEVAKPANKGLLFALGGAVVLLAGAVVFLAMRGSEAPATPAAVTAAVAETSKAVESAAPTSAPTATAPAADTTAVPSSAPSSAPTAGTKVAGTGGTKATPPPTGGAKPPAGGGAAPPPPPPKTSTGGCAPDDLMCLMRAGAKKKGK